MAQKIEPTIRTKPTKPGSRSPGVRNTSTRTRQAPRRKRQKFLLTGQTGNIFGTEKDQQQDQTKNAKDSETRGLEFHENANQTDTQYDRSDPVQPKPGFLGPIDFHIHQLVISISETLIENRLHIFEDAKPEERRGDFHIPDMLPFRLE